MANQGAKKRKEENSRRLKNLLRFIIFSNVFYLVVRAGIFHSTFKWNHWLGFMLNLFAYVLPYQHLAMMAKCTYSESGELEDGGFDLTTDGVCGYLHDVIYITGFVQLTTTIFEKFWYIYLVKALVEANDAKLDGKRLFGDGQYEEALVREKMRTQTKECTKALELNPNYVKALRRRGEAHEKLEHFEEAIADMKKILELDQSDVQPRRTIQRLEPLAAEEREKMKQRDVDKLKEMGNSVLGRFGMSIDNFKAVQDPNTGSYLILFQR